MSIPGTKREEFWLVWSPRLATNSEEFKSFDAAQAEAEKQAKGYPGHDFYVLKATGGARAEVQPIVKLLF